VIDSDRERDAAQWDHLLQRVEAGMAALREEVEELGDSPALCGLAEQGDVGGGRGVGLDKGRRQEAAHGPPSGFRLSHSGWFRLWYSSQPTVM
jgi:hypothetical protein